MMDVKDLVEIVKLKTQGLSHRKIAKKLGIPKTTIGDFLRKETHKEFWINQGEGGEIKGPKVLVLDIETSPILGWVWGMFKQFLSPNQIEVDWQILCFSAKWYGEDSVISCDARDDYPIYLFRENTQEAQKLMVENLWHLLNNADIVVAHNGKKFDIKKINTKFVEFGFPPPSHYRVADTLNIVKNNFGAPTNKLEYWTTFLGQEGKMSHEGFPMWKKCMAGEPSSWVDMTKYCDVDVLELEDVYTKVRAWDGKHPSLAPFYDDGKPHCVVCGGEEFTDMGKSYHTNQSSFALHRCNNCKAVNRIKQNSRSKESMKNTMMAGRGA